MDQYSAVLGALAAGKLPSQQQINKSVESLLQSNLVQIEAQTPNEGKLSPHGIEIARDIRNILEAYKALGASKNGDDILQEALYNLAQGAQSGDVKVQGDLQAPVDEGRSDAQALSSALSTLVHVILGNASGPGSSIFEDVTSFVRLGLADAAESAEHQAAQVKTKLRETDAEVKEGKRDGLGLPAPEERQDGTTDPKEKFERTMDTVKVFGSQTIDAGQRTTDTGKEYSRKSRDRLSDTLEHIIRRSQGDPEYQSAVRTIFGLTRKWLSKPSSSSEAVTLDTFVEDPAGHLSSAIKQLRTLVERCAGGKSLSDVLNAFDDTTMRIRSDEELRKFVDDWLVYAQHNVESEDYYDSDEGRRMRDDLQRRADQLGSLSGEEGKGKMQDYRQSTERLKGELDQYQQGLRNDPDFNRLVDAHAALGKTIAVAAKDIVGSTGIASFTSISWILQDLLDIYLPRVIGLFKDIPLPRTEYTDPQTDFVFENADISSLQLLPGNAHIKQIADIDLAQNQAGTSVAGTTQISVHSVQVDLNAVSFYYHDKESGPLKPSTFTGLLDCKIPPKGVDVEISLSMLPTSAHSEREKSKRFFKVDKVNVQVAKDIELSVTKSNHPILISAFKPIFKTKFREALQTALEKNVTVLVDFFDYTAYDTHLRAMVLKDGGAPTSVAYAGGIWSEIGRLRQLPGPLTGWYMADHGVIKDDSRTDSAFAVGTEPMLLDGDKHGPKSQFTEPRGESGTEGTSGGRVKEQSKGTVQSGLQKGKSFKDRVQAKQNEERKREGWRSDSFDVFIR